MKFFFTSGFFSSDWSRVSSFSLDDSSWSKRLMSKTSSCRLLCTAGEGGRLLKLRELFIVNGLGCAEITKTALLLPFVYPECTCKCDNKVTEYYQLR